MIVYLWSILIIFDIDWFKFFDKYVIIGSMLNICEVFWWLLMLGLIDLNFLSGKYVMYFVYCYKFIELVFELICFWCCSFYCD